MKEVVIDPMTRLEGHGKIVVVLDEAGNCKRGYLQIPEIRGFEKFVEGRHAEDMPQITSRICGVCAFAHHMASTKALDDLFKAPGKYGRWPTTSSCLRTICSTSISSEVQIS
jgi:F420-non-reducing hydrogenase large subunit